MNVKQFVESIGTREDAAKALGVSLRTIYRWLDGTSKPSQLAIKSMQQLVEVKK